MKVALALLMVALAAALMFPASPAYAQIELTEADPADGAELEAPPDIVHLCFSEPVNIHDNTTFDFGYELPDGRRLGLRIVFQPDGECVDVHPGLPDEYPAGEYTLEWQVTAAEGDEEVSGTLRFQVTASDTGEPPLSPTAEGTAPPGTATPEDGEESGDGDDDDGPDILLLSLITIASVGGAAVLFSLGYLLRRRIGYEPHRPPEGDEEGEGD
jgi:methionine-rich copper-binding protein CopC